MSAPSTSSEKPEKPLNELLTSSLVHIYVGTENTHWLLHERLLCYHSSFFRRLFYSPDFESSKTKAYGLPETEDPPFEILVGWLYSKSVRPPAIEKDIAPLLDLYLLSEQLEIEKLGHEVVEAVRHYYHNEESYPSLRRVQYVYANTDSDNEMREMMVNSVARYLTLSDKIPAHWEKALKNNGELSVDIIRSIQKWHLQDQTVPDPRDASQDRGRAPVGFSKIEGDRRSSVGIKSEEDEHSGLNGRS